MAAADARLDVYERWKTEHAQTLHTLLEKVTNYEMERTRHEAELEALHRIKSENEQTIAQLNRFFNDLRTRHPDDPLFCNGY